MAVPVRLGAVFFMVEQRSTLNQALDLFVLDCQAQRFTPSTLRFYHGRLSLFAKWCADHKVVALSDLQASHLRSYLVDMQDRALSSAYVHSHARAIKTFLNYCVRDEFLEKSPFAKVKMPILEKKILPALTDQEIGKLLQACTLTRDKALLLFLIDSGVRASECVKLNAGDVDIKSGVVHVIQGKQQKDRSTFIGAKTRRQLRAYLIERGDPSGPAPLFTSERGGDRLTYYGLAQIFKRLRRKTGLKEFSAHMCRRTFAINCLRGGMNIFVLAKLMGHTDIAVLKHYLALVQDDLQEAHMEHGPIDHMKL